MIIGIDLGTTNSLAAIWRDGKAEMIPNSHGDFMTPSVVGIDNEGHIVVGKIAKDHLVSNPENTTSAFKRYMGSEKTVKLGKHKFRMEELSALILKSIKADAEAYLGVEVTEAVISVPAYFNDTQRQATKSAGSIAGLKVERLINEPTAAAMAYGLHKRDIESQFLVFDLGGGTFDVSILEIFEGIMEVHASAGDNHLGGEDFLDYLVKNIIKKISSLKKIPSEKIESDIGHLIYTLAEKAKRQLTDNKSTKIDIPYQEKMISMDITRDEFIEICTPLLEKIRTPIEKALRDARMKVSDLDEVVLVGGATRMPIIQSMVAKMCGRLPARNIDPDKVIAIGTAIQAGLKSRHEDLKEVVLTDVCPYTLGIEINNHMDDSAFAPGIFSPIIERNTVIPASRVERYYTAIDNQKMVDIKIFQGESRLTKDNVRLGNIEIEIPKKPAGEEQVDVRFTYDINGLLEVEATIVSQEKTKKLIIQENPGKLSEEEIEERLKKLEALKVHPREQSENKAIITRAERLYELMLGDAREAVGRNLDLFQAVLRKQDPKDIEHAKKEMIEFLDQVDDFQYF